MIFTILIGIALIVAIIVCLIRSTETIEKILGPILLMLIALLLFLLCVVIPTSCMSSFNQDIYYEHSGTIQLTAIQDTVTGSFYIGSRNIDESLRYYYCYASKDGYRISNISANDTAILYTEEEPRLEVYKAVGFKNFWLNIFCIPMQTNYKIYIPEGSISTSFAIDLR